ncbi:pirin family protein, partial [Thermaurantiacus sp.]
MIDVRPFATLGAANHGWLDARHHFSFASYFDPSRMGWGALRVWNDDCIASASGFPPHPHRDMEIITYVREGAITHEDSMGNRGRTEAGDVQVMSAGTGVRHAEWNEEPVETRIFQIWIEPRRTGIAPAWGSKPFPKGARAGRFVPLASGLGDPDALPIEADARVLGATLAAGEAASVALETGSHAYLVGARGRFRVNGIEAAAR